MELKLVEKDKKSIVLEIIDMDDTIMTPLIEALLKNDKVTNATYYTGHPQLDNPVLKVTVKSGTPQKIIKEEAEKLAAMYLNAYDEIVMQVGE